MVTIKTGDLLKAKETVIAHQVNCQGVYGGLAAAVFRKWPAAKSDYLTITKRVQPKSLLGMAYSCGPQKDGHIICHLFGQFDPGADYRPERLEQALEQLANCAKIMGWSVSLPYKISCGICGGDWEEVQRIIERTMEDVECVIYRREGD